ncbi:MAG: hypothetical protein ABIO36_00270 [Pyrinomonadaceae bacterium]
MVSRKHGRYGGFGFTIAPQTPGVAEQIELRAFYLEGSEPVGQVSDTKTATMAP